MKRVTEKTSECSKMNDDLKCEPCEGQTAESIPGEAEALLTLNEALSALNLVKKISERMDPSSLLDDTECGWGENRFDPNDLTDELQDPINCETGLQVLESRQPSSTNGESQTIMYICIVCTHVNCK